jgi:AraC-like DNA-binding protein
VIVESVLSAYLEPAIRRVLAGSSIEERELERRLDAVRKAPGEERDRQLFRLVDWIQLEVGNPALGFLIAEQIPLTAFGTGSLGLPIAPTLREGFDIVVRYHRLAAPLILYDLEITGGEAALIVGFRAPIAGGEALFVAAVAGFADPYLARFTGRPRNYSRIELTRPSSGMEREYHRRFGVAPVVGGPVNRLCFDAAHLALASPLGDPLTFEMLRNLCEQEDAALGSLRNAADFVRGLLMARIGDPPALEDLAARARLTVRQLRFALSRAGTSYQKLLRECRIEYVGELARNPDMSFAEIGYRLGYADAANFSTAFKRWTGKSPSQFCKQARR